MTPNKRKALIEARKLIKSGHHSYICHALDCVASKDHKMHPACLGLKRHIMKALYPRTSLEGWQETNNVRPRIPEQRRRDRLAWIDYMLGGEPC